MVAGCHLAARTHFELIIFVIGLFVHKNERENLCSIDKHIIYFCIVIIVRDIVKCGIMVLSKLLGSDFMYPLLSSSEIETISSIIGATETGLTGSEITRILQLCRIPDNYQGYTKRIRLFNSFAERISIDNNSDCVYLFIKETMMPARWLSNTEAEHKMRIQINEVLALKGLQLNDSNEFISIEIATTVSEAKQRASKLKEKLFNLNAHREVLNCCTEELLSLDYFHAVNEAAKSLTNRISQSTGLSDDGTNLIEKAFSTTNPSVILSDLSSKSKRNEYRGIKEMFLGINYAVRNVTAHEMRINWDVNEDEAINVLSIISALHKILDKCQFIMH